MKKAERNSLYLVLCLILVLPLAACGQPNASAPKASPAQSNEAGYPVAITNYDSSENPITFTYQKAPERVVITHPGATELLLELGLEDRILATIAPYGAPLDRVAEKYAKLPILKAKYNPSQEDLLAMQPDMIIGWAHNFRSHEMGDVKSWQERGVGTFAMQSTLTKNEPTVEMLSTPLLLILAQSSASRTKRPLTSKASKTVLPRSKQLPKTYLRKKQ